MSGEYLHELIGLIFCVVALRLVTRGATLTISLKPRDADPPNDDPNS